jgi:phosphatidylglycerophosphate synthase
MSTIAVVLATRPAAARRRVAGMSLLERAVRTSAAAGADVIVTGHDPSVMSALRESNGARFETPARLATVLAAHEGAVTLWLAHVVYDRGAASALLEHTARYESARLGPSLLLARASVATAVVTATDPEAALRNAVADAPRLQERGMPSVDVVSDAGARAATEALWQSCRKPIDGYVSRHLNRYVSLAISRRLVDTPITPNQVSVLCIALGILSGVLAANGGYGYLLAGAALFKLNSILDGVDGELARVRWAYSKAGELLDSAGDNLANFCFFGGVTVAAFSGGEQDLATAGVTGLSLWALYLVLLYSPLWGNGRGDVMRVRSSLDDMRSPLVHAALGLGRKVLRRDSFVMVSFVAAVLGYAPYLLLMTLLGGATVFAYAVLHFATRFFRSAETLEIDPR